MIALAEPQAVASTEAVADPEPRSLTAEEWRAVNWEPPPPRRLDPSDVERLLACCTAATCAVALDPELSPWQAPDALDEFLTRWIESFKTLPGVCDVRTWRLEQRYPAAVQVRHESAPGASRRRTVEIETWPSCLALGLVDGSALVLPRDAHAWRHVARTCRRCGEPAIDPPRRAATACSAECASGVVSGAARRRIAQALHATWTEHRTRIDAYVAEHPLPPDRGWLYDSWMMSVEDKLSTYSGALACPGLDLRATSRRQVGYGRDTAVFVLADGSEFTQGGVEDWRWSPARPKDARPDVEAVA